MPCPTSQAIEPNLQLDPTQADLLAPGQVPDLTKSLVSSESQSQLQVKTVSFDSRRDVRLFEVNSKVSDYIDQTQVCTEVEQFMAQFEPKVFLMVGCLGLDHSVKEIFYKTTYTNPLANTVALEDETDDFNY